MNTFRNETEEHVMHELIYSSLWKRRWQNLEKLNVTFKYASKHSFAIFVNGIHSGLFISVSSINENDLKELGWAIKGKTDNYVNK